MSFRIRDTSYKSENEDEDEDDSKDDHKDDSKNDSKDEDDNSPTHKKKSIKKDNKKVPVIQTKHNSSYSFKVNYDSTNQPDYF